MAANLRSPSLMLCACLPVEEAAVLAPYRAQQGWEVCVEEEVLWVHAPQRDAAAWQRLPFTERYEQDAAGRLTRVGQRVPCCLAPVGPWVPLRHWLPLQRGTALMGGVRPLPATVAPVRATAEAGPVDVLVVDWQVWYAWVLQAPLLRLAPLSFALGSDHRVCVRGQPLAPLPGVGWVRQGQVALPVGWAFPRHCTAAWLLELLGVAQGSLVLWHPDGNSEVIPHSAFIPASRANVRASAATLHEGWSLPDVGPAESLPE